MSVERNVSPVPVCPELVEGLLFFSSPKMKKKDSASTSSAWTGFVGQPWYET
jgi:hypothetical protein